MTGRLVSLFLILFMSCGSIWPQSDNGAAVERTYPFTVDAVQKALQQIGGFGGGKLPGLDGFVTSTDPERYDHPYFQYRVHLKSVDANTTLVSVIALRACSAPVDPRARGRPSVKARACW